MFQELSRTEEKKDIMKKNFDDATESDVFIDPLIYCHFAKYACFCSIVLAVFIMWVLFHVINQNLVIIHNYKIGLLSRPPLWLLLSSSPFVLLGHGVKEALTVWYCPVFVGVSVCKINSILFSVSDLV